MDTLAPHKTNPTGRDLVDRDLDPLGVHPSIAPHVRLRQRVTAISRLQVGKLEEDRESCPFLMETVDSDNRPRQFLASGVIDATDTWRSPNPVGANGLPVPGERELAGSISYGVPDFSGELRQRFAGRRTLVVGGGQEVSRPSLTRDRLWGRNAGGDTTGGKGDLPRDRILDVLVPVRLRPDRAGG